MSLLDYAKIYLCLSYVLTSSTVASIPLATEINGTIPSPSSHFLYFAYGSNLLKERLQLKNPSATFVTAGRLQNHTLRFGHWREDFDGSNSWHGGVATITQSEGEDVWGVIWRLEKENQASLDRQEGVKRGIYRPIEVGVATDEGMVVCRSYQMNNYFPFLPSPPYKQVVWLGAKQNGLPEHYIRKLEAVKTNDYSGPSILDDLDIIDSSGKKPS